MGVDLDWLIIILCGLGVMVLVLVFVLVLLGCRDVVVYDGLWLEWG